ncbi:LOW QUALITY PROTEIN: hypothetical protein PAHAL_8G116700 [Panicum hallii]|uniref:Uncharacterized protein n=1 Tax=Panicum hallii TaxID=206008 RepID=A0A2T8I8I9_9POAL|nr:LOW QUALITY PROTEIN: hypothetical protein PAHAL_8G116700 [Panicum hallii]
MAGHRAPAPPLPPLPIPSSRFIHAPDTPSLLFRLPPPLASPPTPAPVPPLAAQARADADLPLHLPLAAADAAGAPHLGEHRRRPPSVPVRTLLRAQSLAGVAQPHPTTRGPLPHAAIRCPPELPALLGRAAKLSRGSPACRFTARAIAELSR